MGRPPGLLLGSGRLRLSSNVSAITRVHRTVRHQEFIKSYYDILSIQKWLSEYKIILVRDTAAAQRPLLLWYGDGASETHSPRPKISKLLMGALVWVQYRSECFTYVLEPVCMPRRIS